MRRLVAVKLAVLVGQCEQALSVGDGDSHASSTEGVGDGVASRQNGPDKGEAMRDMTCLVALSIMMGRGTGDTKWSEEGIAHDDPI